MLVRLWAVIKAYWDLGFTSFGGPGAHVVLLRKRFVDNLRWVDEVTFLDLFALGNALPGPGSTQLAFSIAVVAQGVLPGLLAFLLWSLPGAIGMLGLGLGISHIPDTLPAIVLALLTGLNAAAVGLIALAAEQLGRGAATDRLTLALVWLSASFGICYHAPWMYPVLIVAGGLSTLLWDFRRQLFIAPARRAHARARKSRNKEPQDEGIEIPSVPYTPDERRSPSIRPAPSLSICEDEAPADSESGGAASTNPGSIEAAREHNLRVISTRAAVALLLAFALFLTTPLATRAGLRNAGRAVPRALDFFSNMIVAGTIIFGGGPVVIPLLRDYVVAEGWVTDRDFLLVFAILQAFPGPNFNFAVALGVLALRNGLGGVLGYIGIFAPGILLKLALLPLYANWRDRAAARSVIRGLNAAASGLVFTAVWQLFLVGYVHVAADGASRQAVSGPLTADPFWAVVASGSFLACRNYRAPPWLAVGGGAVAGLCWYGVHLKR
ncbi:hypothetical protein CspeluHIS016_0501490 [Cutaneotrichosporon spelunceum]|uniref:Chromate transporter n=1 Tax=Cutaneotrichosporon spelunceum TaxID=1672016 RepID=A0AAD3YDM6_9TREE|nr:hypothetical protein CspeluHIS016_0501490 [Cutaneotrichosporon spelunceum]